MLSTAVATEDAPVGMAVAEDLVHTAKHGIPDDPNPGEAFSEFFIEVLVADDDNGNLSDLTPHFYPIVFAFNNHGIGTGYMIQIVHTPSEDQLTNGPYPITAQFQYPASFGSFYQATLCYSVNGSPVVCSQCSPMSASLCSP